MKIFLVLCSITLASCASLDGYQYKQQGGGGGFIGNSLIGSSGGGGHSHHHQEQQGFIGIPAPNTQGLIAPPQLPQLPSPPQSSYGVPHQSSSIQGQAIHQHPLPLPIQGPAPSFQQHGHGHGHGHGHSQQGAVTNLAPVITKDVYIHVAPEEPEEHVLPQNVQQQAPRKHYRIIFIKAPSQSSRSAALKLAQAQQQIEEKTVIYVLSKKTDASDIHAALQQVPQPVQHKPEVFFIKYKTQQEALHAQQQIQAQYDALGGTSQINDEGIAPISSVIGALGNQGGGSGHGHGGGHNIGHNIGGHGSSHGGNHGGSLISGPSGSGGGLISQQNSAYLPPHRH